MVFFEPEVICSPAPWPTNVFKLLVAKRPAYAPRNVLDDDPAVVYPARYPINVPLAPVWFE